MRLLAILLLLTSCSTSPPRERFITTSDGTRLQVLDWGGSGETVVLLAGLANTAYVYSDFAPRLTSRFRVIGITRRGHGRSGPAREHTPEVLARDLRDVLDRLGVRSAHIVGHSLAGSEMTVFAARYPERTSSLIYIDAAYDRQMQRELDAKHEDPVPWKQAAVADLASIDAYMKYRRRRDALPGAYFGQIWGAALEADAKQTIDVLPDGTVRERAVDFEKFYEASAAKRPNYMDIKAPILAIYAESADHPFLPPHADDELRKEANAYHRNVIRPWTEASIRELREAQPSAKIVEMNGLHHLFIQQPERIASMINEFIDISRP